MNFGSRSSMLPRSQFAALCLSSELLEVVIVKNQFKVAFGRFGLTLEPSGLVGVLRLAVKVCSGGSLSGVHSVHPVPYKLQDIVRVMSVGRSTQFL